MNIYFKGLPFEPFFLLFGAKCDAFWCKTQCNMVQNAVRFGAKYKVKWCKTQGEMVLNAVRNGTKCKAKSINIHCNGINKTF